METIDRQTYLAIADRARAERIARYRALVIALRMYVDISALSSPSECSL